MAVIEFNDGLVKVLELLPDDRQELPAKKIFDTLMRYSIESYFDIHEVVTNTTALWESLSVNPNEKWVKEIEDFIILGFEDTMRDVGKKPDYGYEMRYKDGVLTIPYLNKDPRCSSGFRPCARVDVSVLVGVTKKHLRFNKQLDDGNYLDIAIQMFVNHFKTTLMGFITPCEHPLATYFEKHQLVEIAYSINDDAGEKYEDDTIDDLVNFIFEAYFKDVDFIMSDIYRTLDISPSTIVELYKKDTHFHIFKSTETLEEVVFRQVFDLGTCSIKDAEQIKEKDYCQSFV